jgi:hypothetical protein
VVRRIIDGDPRTAGGAVHPSGTITAVCRGTSVGTRELHRRCPVKTVAIVVALVLVIATVGYFALARKHPEDAAGHRVEDPSESTNMYGNTDDRPAGPGAEADGVTDGGQIAPGPSAESLPQSPEQIITRPGTGRDRP